MKKIEGYWYECDRYDRTGEKYPMPVANTIDLSIKKDFIEKLKQIQKISHEIHYRGFSGCRICNCLNGTFEYEYEDWVWPEGYLHYIQDHNVAPTKEFYDFIMNTELISQQ